MLNHKFSKSILALSLITSSAAFAQTTYTVDPSHTYASFAADHMGLSMWRGKFNSTSGSVVLDIEKQTGSVNILIQANSIDFGHEKMNEHARKDDIFAVEKYPEVKYVGDLVFEQGQPVGIEGFLTMKGVTLPVPLVIDTFTCKMHPMLKKEVCGANASGSLNRADFGVDYAVAMGFDPVVELQISIEALKAD